MWGAAVHLCGESDRAGFLRGIRTQEAVGKIVGVKRYSVCGYEKGNNYPEVPVLIALADYFGVSTD